MIYYDLAASEFGGSNNPNSSVLAKDGQTAGALPSDVIAANRGNALLQDPV